LKFNKCKFINAVTEKNKVVKGISLLPDDYSKDNVLVMEDCEFIGPFDYNIYMKQGGSVDLKNVTFDGKKGLYLHSVVNASNYRYKADLDNVKMKKNETETVVYRDHKSNQITTRNMLHKSLKGSGKRNFGTTKILKK